MTYVLLNANTIKDGDEEWLLACMASNVVQLAARIEQEKVGKPFFSARADN